MPAVLLPPSRPARLPFSQFLAQLFAALDAVGVRFCVLRNYQDFPEKNLGSDVDFLINPANLAKAIGALQSIPGVRITGYSERAWVAHAFVEGLEPAPGKRALQVDFLYILNWKGQPYLPVDTVLDAALPHRAGDLSFLVPSPVHEAIASLFASLLVGGWLKEKYFPQVQQIFSANRAEAIAALAPQFGWKVSTRLVDAVIVGYRRKIVGFIGPLRWALARRNLLGRPLRAVSEAVRYYLGELVVDFAPAALQTVFILGEDGAKAELIDHLMPLLTSSAKFVKKSTLRPQITFTPKSWSLTPSNESAAQIHSGSLFSIIKVAFWLMEEWLSQFTNKRNLTITLCEGCYHDLLADPESFGYRGPMGFARFVRRLMPSPVLCLLLDSPAEGATKPKMERMRALVKTKQCYFILDAGKPAGQVTENAYAAIIDALAGRADNKLRRRLSYRRI
ncbi:MAG: hypothetical protein ABR991_02690 [Terracidiphilus sp.]